MSRFSEPMSNPQPDLFILTRGNVKELKSPNYWDTVPLWPEFSLATKDGAMTDADFMRMAIQAAREGMGKGEMPFGACIVHKGKSWLSRITARRRISTPQRMAKSRLSEPPVVN